MDERRNDCRLVEKALRVKQAPHTGLDLRATEGDPTGGGEMES